MNWAKKNWIVLTATLILIAPLIAGVIILIVPKNVFDNADFWYGYMAYFGTVVLAAVAFWQSQKAEAINERLLRLEEIKYLPSIDIRTPIYNAKHDDERLETTPVQIFAFRCNSTDNGDFVFSVKNISETYIPLINILSLTIYDRSSSSEVLRKSYDSLTIEAGSARIDSGCIRLVKICGISTNIGDTIRIELKLRIKNHLFESYSCSFSLIGEIKKIAGHNTLEVIDKDCDGLKKENSEHQQKFIC